jgi:hypothetical protein
MEPGANGRPSIPKMGIEVFFVVMGNLFLWAKLISRKLPSAPLSIRAEAGSQIGGDDIKYISKVNLLFS